VVKSAALPFYPPIAVMARLTGTVCLRLTVKGGSVQAVEARSSASLMLQAAAEANAKTWQFFDHYDGAVTPCYIFRIEGRLAHRQQQNPTIILELPNRVTITARPNPEKTQQSATPSGISRGNQRLARKVDAATVESAKSRPRGGAI